MTITQLVARGTLRLLSGVFTARALDFAFYLLLARTLGVEQFGRHAFALSFTLLFSVLADFGITTVFQREAARAPAAAALHPLLATALRIKLLLAGVTSVATLGISLATGAPPTTLALVALFTLGLVLNSMALLFEGVLKVAGRPGLAGLSIASQAVVSVGVGVALLANGGGLFSGAFAYMAGAVVHLATAAWWTRSLMRDRSVADRSGMPGFSPDGGLLARESAPHPAALTARDLIREAAPLAMTGIFIAIYFRLDSVLLNVFQGTRAVGLYGGIYRFFEAMVLLSAAYRSVLFPFMSRRADGPAESLAVLCRKSFRLHLILTIGVAAFFTVQAPAIISLLLGPQYLDAAPALCILMWALPGAFMADTLLHLLIGQRRQVDSARAVAVTATFSVALNLFLIPRLSLVGAAISTVASELLSFSLMFMAFRRTVPGIGLARAVRAPLLGGFAAAVAMSALGPVAPDGVLGLLVTGSSGVMVYLLVLVGLGAVGREDATLVREMMPAGSRAAEEREAA